MRCRLYYRPGHPKANAHGFVDSRDLEEAPPEPTHVPIVTDRFMEGDVTVDGQDIGSRRKRKDYMNRNGYADANDFSPEWREANQRIREREQEANDLRAVRDTWNRLVKP